MCVPRIISNIVSDTLRSHNQTAHRPGNQLEPDCGQWFGSRQHRAARRHSLDAWSGVNGPVSDPAAARLMVALRTAHAGSDRADMGLWFARPDAANGVHGYR